ncbi:hypothetical protein DFH27DRAFT_637205 [Peziza echinospora]|nr:hypothetical protein DFH27DRAFT_637205 [Peziza echinospora]
MVLLEQFLEEFNMFVRLQLVALLYHHYQLDLHGSFRKYHHSNPQARMTNTSMSHFQSGIQAYLTCSFECSWLHCSTITIGTWSTINMVLLEQFLEEFNMFVRLQLVALLYHHYRWLHCPTIAIGSKPPWLHMLECKQHMVNHQYGVVGAVPGGLQYNIIQLDLHALFRQVSSLEPTSTHDEHSNVTLSEWNLGLLQGLNRLHQVPGLQLGYWWSCAQGGLKLPWSHILECKQHMVNHQYGVVGAVPGGVQHVCLIAAGCTTLPSLSECKQHMVNHQYGVVGAVPGGVQHVCSIAAGCTALPSLSEWNLGLLDMFVRMQVVALLYHRYRLDLHGSFRKYHHSNPQARMTNTAMSHFQSGIQAYLTCSFECKWLHCSTIAIGSQDYNLNIGGVVPTWLQTAMVHILECKQHMVNHQYGVVGAVPGGVQHVCSIAAGCTALPSLSGKFLQHHLA